MRNWGAHKTIRLASAGVALVIVAVVVLLLTRPPTAGCAGEAAADHKVQEINATKVVVQPWLGPHEVYGIFMVPNRYRNNQKYVGTLTVRGLDHHFPVGSSGQEYVGDVSAEPGHYLLRKYVPTRVALWFLVNGLFGDLRHHCNWTLVFLERSPERSR